MDDEYFFESYGLDEARKVAYKLGYLNCCEDVSKAVENLALYSNVNCDTVRVIAFTKNDTDTLHYVILYKDKLIDYTQKQFFGSDNPNDIECNIIKKYISNNNTFFTNNVFYDQEGNLFMTYDLNVLLEKLNNGTIIPDTDDYIIYQIYSSR